MAIDPTSSDSSASHDSHRDTPSKDELLEQLHLDYVNQVSESGIPLWVLDMYSSLSFQVGENPPPFDNQL
jgi:hypothetical protein